MNWMPIETDPKDRSVKLKGRYIPSDEAARNGAKACDVFGEGRFLWNSRFYQHGLWSGILGGHPTQWSEA